MEKQDANSEEYYRLFFEYLKKNGGNLLSSVESRIDKNQKTLDSWLCKKNKSSEGPSISKEDQTLVSNDKSHSLENEVVANEEQALHSCVDNESNSDANIISNSPIKISISKEYYNLNGNLKVHLDRVSQNKEQSKSQDEIADDDSINDSNNDPNKPSYNFRKRKCIIPNKKEIKKKKLSPNELNTISELYPTPLLDSNNNLTKENIASENSTQDVEPLVSNNESCSDNLSRKREHLIFNQVLPKKKFPNAKISKESYRTLNNVSNEQNTINEPSQTLSLDSNSNSNNENVLKSSTKEAEELIVSSNENCSINLMNKKKHLILNQTSPKKNKSSPNTQTCPDSVALSNTCLNEDTFSLNNINREEFFRDKNVLYFLEKMKDLMQQENDPCLLIKKQKKLNDSHSLFLYLCRSQIEFLKQKNMKH